MKSLFIVDDHISSKYNGLGTFVETIMPRLKMGEMRLNLISYNEDSADFCIEYHDDYTIYKIPEHRGIFIFNAIPSLTLLRLHIKDSPGNVFWISHCPCVDYLKAIKSLFPKSKRVMLLHNQMWAGALLGDVNLYKKIISLEKVHGKKAIFYKKIRKNKRIEQRMYSLSHHVVCLCNSTYHILQDVYHVPTEKLSIISNGIDASCFNDVNEQRQSLRQELGISPDEVVLLFSGRVVKEKGIFHLLDAFETLWKENHKLRLIIAGYTVSYQDYTTHMPKSISHVTFTGSIPRKTIYKWYKAADIGVLPTYTEQCSYTGLEMMASRLLVVSTNGNGVCDMFDDSCALIIDAKEETMSASLTDALRKAIKISNKEKEKLVNSAYNKVVSEYSIQRMQDGYMEMLEKMFKAK